MYPFVRLTKEILKARRQPPLPLLGTHVSHHVCWPWDIDMFLEMNNGRTLTMYDLNRLPLAARVRLDKALLKNRWGLTMAGATIRWRARIRAFQRFEIRSRALGWDDKFIYLEQSMGLKGDRCAGHIMYRSAVTDKDGIVAPEKVLAAMGQSMPSPPLPDWVEAWIKADSTRPWPPMQDG